MAHEIDFSKGSAAVFSVKETPWHSLGAILADAPTLDEALRLGGLDFDVQLDAMQAIFEQNGVRMVVDVPDARAVRRADTNGIIGTVGPSYHVLQNVDAFAPLAPLLDAGLATIETGGALRGGRDVWMLVKFNLQNEKALATLGDEVLPYGLISNNHNGARKVTIQETPVRVVCANTLGFALRQAGVKENGRTKAADLTKAVQVRHTTNVKANVVEAAKELFTTIDARYGAIAAQYDAMKATKMTEIEFEKVILDLIAPLPEKPKTERKDNIAVAAFEKATDRAIVKRNRLTALWTDGDGHVGDGSAWEAYQGAVQSLDHDADIWKAGNRLESLFDGTIAKDKQALVNSVVDFCMATV
jgi:phage/plasmid-like protein (TIGR03299 family)